MNWVPLCGGCFRMGAEDLPGSTPVHEVTVPAFEVLQSEVTIAMYRACLNDDGCLGDLPGSGNTCTWGKQGVDQNPLNCVDRAQSRAFAQWVGGGARLCTEAEWEYAARSGGQEWRYPWGDDAPTCERVVMREGEANGCGSAVLTWPVCSKHAGDSEQGVCDLAGNLWEWVDDLWHESYDEDGDGVSDAPTDGSAWNVGDSLQRVLRGGDWSNSHSSQLRAARRYHNLPNDRWGHAGFRLCRSR
ncbi:MAG: formylglycine-generating enzyme family protein [Deltaproteobacteria bacterium]|nr:formylglycine-generating enzyme family protein [Deltaproteobacteria bacterium]